MGTALVVAVYQEKKPAFISDYSTHFIVSYMSPSKLLQHMAGLFNTYAFTHHT